MDTMIKRLFLFSIVLSFLGGANICLAACGIGANEPLWYSSATVTHENAAVDTATETIEIPDSELNYAEVTIVFVSYVYDCKWGDATAPSASAVTCGTCPTGEDNRVSVTITNTNAPILIHKKDSGEEYLTDSCTPGSVDTADLARGWQLIEIGAGKPKNLSVSLQSMLAGVNIKEYYVGIMQHGPAGPATP